MKLVFVLVLVSAFTDSSVLYGQKQPVSWSISIDSVKNGIGKARFTALIAPGWHLYSQFMAEGGPIPTSFTFIEDGYRLQGNAQEQGLREVYHDQLYDMEVAWFSSQVIFSHPIEFVRKDAMVRGSIEYMVCSQEVCVPGKKEFAVSLAAAKH